MDQQTITKKQTDPLASLLDVRMSLNMHLTSSDVALGIILSTIGPTDPWTD